MQVFDTKNRILKNIQNFWKKLQSFFEVSRRLLSSYPQVKDDQTFPFRRCFYVTWS